MERYTIYCTEEQTKKALALGAPIVKYNNAITSHGIPHFIEGTVGKEWTLYFIPTAEQMLGWLEEQGDINFITVSNIDYDLKCWYYDVNTKDDTVYLMNLYCNSRKEATLAAIDAALDYLTNKK